MSDSFRPDAIYVERQTRRGFYYVPRPEGETVDGLINRILTEWLADQHPGIVRHLKEQAEADKQFRDNYEKARQTPGT